MNTEELKAAYPNISEDTIKANRAILAGVNPSPPNDTVGRAIASKYRNIRTGHYASRKEAKYAEELSLRQKAGDISFWLEQVPFQLPGGVIHRLDFAIFKGLKGIYEVDWVEVKGKDLAMGKLKRKQVESIYGIHVQVV
jgi:hypothetical protein